MDYQLLSKAEKETVNKLLDLTCIETGEQIKVGDMVAMYNWGIGSSEIIGYGIINWDSQLKEFSCDIDNDYCKMLGIPNAFEIDNYDQWRSPMKLIKHKNN